ncbi:multidrug transporter [Tenggerimyces flavus]|uniref:Multidrug transporter n=1 Tax=Tenggerimyces flavus TaxID=1708749 RepID=A0ABV7YH96_9ACTN|nr:multidrug transporter [Tenggerimyces flavus]MBM7786072.1 hypothetical protein [Tenggerimyces flavus]
MVLRRMRTLAVLELANVIIISVALLAVFRMPPTVSNLTGLVLVAAFLVEGGVYWWLKARQLVTRAPAPAGMATFRLLRRVNVVLLAAGAVVIAADSVASGMGVRSWPGVALWVFAVLEYVNYFHVQLMHDTRADLARLFTRGLHRSHLARDLTARR